MQGAFAAVYELDVDEDVNRVLFALREPQGTCAVGSPGRALAVKSASGVLRNVQHMAACLAQLAQANGNESRERALDGCLDAESALARLGVRERLQRLQLLPRAP